MSEKKFRVRFEQEDGRGEIVDEKGVELTAREVVDCLNEQQSEINSLKLELELRTGAKLFSRRELERKVDEQQSTINKLQKELASVCVQKSLLCDELEILKKVMTDE